MDALNCPHIVRIGVEGTGDFIGLEMHASFRPSIGLLPLSTRRSREKLRSTGWAGIPDDRSGP